MHNIYILRSYTKDGSVIKVGYSSRIKRRINTYKDHNPSVEVVATYYRENGHLYELALHTTFEACWKREWYSEEQLTEIIKWIEANKVAPIEVTALKPFRAAVEEIKQFYSVCKTNTYTQTQQTLIDATFKKYSFLERALYTLGFEGVKNLNYVQTNIKRKLIRKVDTDSTANKVYKMLKLHSDMSAGNFVSNKVLKERLKTIYKELGIGETPKASDISKYFDNKATKARVKGGKPVNGVILLNSKVIFNNEQYNHHSFTN